MWRWLLLLLLVHSVHSCYLFPWVCVWNDGWLGLAWFGLVIQWRCLIVDGCWMVIVADLVQPLSLPSSLLTHSFIHSAKMNTTRCRHSTADWQFLCWRLHNARKFKLPRLSPKHQLLWCRYSRIFITLGHHPLWYGYHYRCTPDILHLVISALKMDVELICTDCRSSWFVSVELELHSIWLIVSSARWLI